MDLPEKPISRNVTDEQLVEFYRAGHTDAFAVLVKRYRQELYHFLIRFTGNRASAEDVFQETFLQVHLSLDSFQVDRKFKPWLFTIGANKARDHLRRNKRRSAVPLSAPLQQAGGEDQRSYLDLMQAELPLPDEHAVCRETEERVTKVVHSLPDHLREILVLAYFHQLPYKEIADILEIPLGTVKSRLHAAVGTFGKLWKEQAETSEDERTEPG